MSTNTITNEAIAESVAAHLRANRLGAVRGHDPLHFVAASVADDALVRVSRERRLFEALPTDVAAKLVANELEAYLAAARRVTGSETEER